MKRQFQTWHVEEVQKELAIETAIPDVKIDICTSILKLKRANWLIWALVSLFQKPENVIRINDFRKAGILN